MTDRTGHPTGFLAAYTLGACSAEEAEWVAKHLESCPDCARNAARLRAGAEVLAADVAAVEPPAHVREGVLAQVGAEASLFEAARSSEPGLRPVARPLRQRLLAGIRPRALAMACALLLAAGGGGAYLATALQEDDPQTLTAQLDDRAPGASATLEIRDRRARLRVAGLPRPGLGRVYQIWIRKGREAPRPAGTTFRVDSNGAAETQIPRDISEVDELLVTSEPEGGSTLPTRAPLLKVDTSA